MAILAAYPHLACPVDEGGNVLERHVSIIVYLFIHPLYTVIAVYAPIYTRHTCIYTIYTSNTPRNTLYTPFIHPKYTLSAWYRGARKVRIPTDPGIYTEVLCPVEETFDLLGKVRKEEGEQ